MKRIFLLTILLIMVMSISKLSAQPKGSWTAEEQAVLDVVNLFFESMTKRDTTTLARVMTKEGRYYGLREAGGNWSTHTATHAKYLSGLANGQELLLERIWDPTIKVHKTIAMLWAPYDIYVDKKFIHCGVDAFSLIKTEDGWKIAGTVFTMEPEGCTESPLGPIKNE